MDQRAHVRQDAGMSLNLSFLGAAGTVTGSKLRHRIEAELRWPCLVPDHGQKVALA
jgi:hypothetical protein